MKTTYDENTLTITATRDERRELKRRIKAIAKQQGWSIDGATCQEEYNVLDEITFDGELETIRPEDIGALTSAPILGVRNGPGDNKVSHAWAFKEYAVRSFVEDLIETGKAVFRS